MTQRLKKNQYRCAACHGVFYEGWSNAEAAAEFTRRHPGLTIGPDTLVICDRCYRLLDQGQRRGDMQD